MSDARILGIKPVKLPVSDLARSPASGTRRSSTHPWGGCWSSTTRTASSCTSTATSATASTRPPDPATAAPSTPCLVVARREPMDPDPLMADPRGARIAWITIAPVKSLALRSLPDALLGRDGVAGDRAFHLIDDAGRLVNGKRHGRLMLVRPEIGDGRLALRFPDGTVIDGAPELGEPVTTGFYGRPVGGRLVRGPWSQALSDYARIGLRLVRVERPGDGVDRGSQAAATLLGTGSLDALAAAGGLDRRPDPRRFRMLLGVDGIAPHAEDGWLGRRVRVGGAVVVPQGNVGRCVVTTYDPGTAGSDLDTLHLLAGYRADVDTTEALPFGIWAEVARPGRVAVGDPVAVD